MEWIIALILGLGFLIWALVYLIQKLRRFAPVLKKLQQQVELLERAQASSPEIAKLAGALGQDPELHLARRLEIQRAARKRKRQRERRLISRVL
jgi:hypothetical protein